MRRAAIGVGAREQHQHVGARRERAPRLGAVDEPAAVGLRRARRDAGDVAAEVRLGHRDRGEDLARGEARQPAFLLFLSAAVHERARQDLRSRDQRSADAQGAPRQFLGRHDHAEVLRLAAGGEAAELLGHRETEATEFGEARDHRLGDVGVGPVDVFGVRADLFEGESVEGVGDHREVLTEVARPGALGEAGDELGIAVGRRRMPRTAGTSRRRRPTVRSRPRTRVARSLRAMREERRHELGLDVALARRRPATRAPWRARSRRGRGRRRGSGARRCRHRRAARRARRRSPTCARSRSSDASARSSGGAGIGEI